MTKNNTTEPTGLQQAMAAVDAGTFRDPNYDGAAKSDPTAVPLDTPIEPSVPKRLRGFSELARGAPIQSSLALPDEELQQLIGAGPANIQSMPADVEAIVSTRATTHGNYADTANVSQALKRVIALAVDNRNYRGQPPLTDRQQESLDLICTKIARILSGDSGLDEHWLDIGGYARIAN